MIVTNRSPRSPVGDGVLTFIALVPLHFLSSLFVRPVHCSYLIAFLGS